MRAWVINSSPPADAKPGHDKKLLLQRYLDFALMWPGFYHSAPRAASGPLSPALLIDRA
jgi:hypothetical protein